MPRFRWRDPREGRKISNYINVMCTKYPDVAREVVKHGIGELDSWFSQGTNLTARTTCGCLVGTTALVAMKKYRSCANALPAMRTQSDTSDAAVVLFNFLRIRQGKSILNRYDIDMLPDKERALFECIEEAGMAASNEGNAWTFGPNREQHVIDHIEMSIRKKLGIKK